MTQQHQNGPATRFSLEDKLVYVCGHRGMVGQAVARRLQSENCRLLQADSRELDLRRQADVEAFFERHRPDVVVLAAAKVGGIVANNTQPAPFLYDNLTIETNVIHAAHRFGAEKLLFLGSSCIYPKFAEQPIREEALLTGPLEPTNQWYAIAKISGLMMCAAYRRQYGADFISAMPTNLYGPGDNFDLKNSHVAPALLRKAHCAKKNAEAALEIWGTGAPRREFLFVDDLADALVVLLKTYSDEAPINVGVGEDVTIRELAEKVAQVVGYEGALTFDTTKPDGTPRKLLDVSRLRALGWTATTSLQEGLAKTYEWVQQRNIADAW